MTRERAEKVGDNHVVALAFVLTDADDTQLEEAPQSDPLVYLHGQGNLMPGLEEALTGREVGERFKVTIPPADAFGVATEAAERTLPRDALPEDMELEPGLPLAIEEDDDVIPVWVTQVTDAHVVVSLDHPWAGKTVTFEGEVLMIREANPSELEHGHPHGLEGDEPHHHGHDDDEDDDEEE